MQKSRRKRLRKDGDYRLRRDKDRGILPAQTTGKNDPTLKRIGGYLHRIVPVVNDAGKVLYFSIKPLMVEFRPRDVMQVIVGAALFAIPLSFTQEVWELGGRLPIINVVGIFLFSVFFIAAFVFFNTYRFNIRKNLANYFLRVIGTYILSMLVVGTILTLIGKCPWGVDNVLAIKRIVLVTFPASMSGTLSDTIR